MFLRKKFISVNELNCIAVHISTVLSIEHFVLEERKTFHATIQVNIRLIRLLLNVEFSKIYLLAQNINLERNGDLKLSLFFF